MYVCTNDHLSFTIHLSPRPHSNVRFVNTNAGSSTAILATPGVPGVLIEGEAGASQTDLTGVIEEGAELQTVVEEQYVP